MTEFTLTQARPYGFKFPLRRTALLLIDMQRDFLDEGGFGFVQCGNPKVFASVRKIVPVVQRVLERARQMGMQIIHTREGHRPDLLDLPAAKRLRQISAPNGHHNLAIGDQGPMGRLLVRGEYGHDIVDELKPRLSELVIDKPGKGSFWGTSLHRDLLARGITHLLVAGVSTECCVTTTIRECNDRGYECCLLADCTDGFDAQMVKTGMDTICAQDGLFGYVGHGNDFLEQTLHYSSPSPDCIPTAELLPSIRELLLRYRLRSADPVHFSQMVYNQIEEYKATDAASWIEPQTRENIFAAAKSLASQYQNTEDLPALFGVPFMVQDSIDVAGIPTSAPREPYVPDTGAPAAQALLNAGAICIGRLTVDQPAGGMVGPISTSGSSQSMFDGEHIVSGAPSAAAITVRTGLVPFTLMRDTTGNSLVSGGLNGVATLKPTPGTVSTRGVIPVCPSLDTISIIARTIEDARTAWLEIQKPNALDDSCAKRFASLPTWHIDARSPRPSFRFAVPPPSMLDAACAGMYKELFAAAIGTLQRCGGTLVEIDHEPFDTAKDICSIYDEEDNIVWSLLVNEHISTVGTDTLINSLPLLHPELQKIYRQHLYEPAPKPWSIFQTQTRLAKCANDVHQIFNPLNPKGIDILVVPSAPVFTRAVNALDLCAVGLNAGYVPAPGDAAGTRLPFGITFMGGTGYDAKVWDLAECFAQAQVEVAAE